MSSIPFFARRFVAGVELTDAIQRVASLNNSKITTSLDILGENVVSEATAREAEAAYEKVADGIKDHGLSSHISIKLTMLGLDISNDLAEELLRKLVSYCKQLGNLFIRIDMEGSAYTSRTVDLFLKVRNEFDNIGIVLQTMLLRTEDDLKSIIAASGRVRLCKGAYKEPESIALQNMNDIRKNYLKLAGMLLEQGNFPAFATHDDLLICEVKKMAAARKVDPRNFEFQMLYGLRRNTWHEIVREGYPMRVYVPFGSHWFPYFSRRLRERKENIFFLLKNLFKG